MGGTGCATNLPAEVLDGEARAVLHLGFGRIVASEIELPNMLLDLL